MVKNLSITYVYGVTLKYGGKLLKKKNTEVSNIQQKGLQHSYKLFFNQNNLLFQINGKIIKSRSTNIKQLLKIRTAINDHQSTFS